MKNFTYRIYPVLGVLCTFLILLGRANICYAETITAVKTGNWNSLETWSAKVPGATDSVVIPANITVHIPNGYSAECDYLTLNLVNNVRATSSSTRNLVNLSSNNSRLTVYKDINIYPLAGPGTGNAITLNVGSGTVYCNNLTLFTSVSDGKDAEVTVSGGTLNVTSTLKANDNQLRNAVRLTQAATLNIMGSYTGIGQLSVDNTSVVNIQGDWLNPIGGSISGTVNYNGNRDQQVGRADYFNLSLSGGGRKMVTTSATVAGLVTVQANTTLHTNDELRLLATASSNANIGPLLNGAKIIGNVFFQQYLTGGTRTFRSLSAPVKATFDQYRWWMIVTGYGGEENGFDKGASVNPDGATIKYYRESDYTNSIYPYEDLKSLCDSIPTAGGYYFYFRGNRNGDYKVERNPATGQYDVPEDVVMEFWGPINTGNIKIPLKKTSLGEDSDGYNMIGNPYPSTIDWNSASILKRNIKSTIWTLRKNGGFATWDGNFGTNGGSNLILPGQGFFVQVEENSASGEIEFTEYAKSNGSPTETAGGVRLLVTKASYETSSNPKKQPIKHLRLSLTDVNNLSDETVIAFNKKSAAEKNDEDALYFGGSGVYLSSLSSDKKQLAINYMPEDKDSTEVGLYVNGATGNYTLTVSDFTTLKDKQILIHDAALKQTVNLKETGSFSFAINRSDPGTFGSERFKLLVFDQKKNKDKEKKIKFAGRATAAGAELRWELDINESDRYFKIERSSDGKEFKEYARIEISERNKKSFSYLDKLPTNGFNYYRIQAVGEQGTFSSEPLALSYGFNKPFRNSLNIYPNPASTEPVEIKISEKDVNNIRVNLYDLNGQKIKQSMVNNRRFSVADLQSGVYIVEAIDPDTSTSYGKVKLIKN